MLSLAGAQTDFESECLTFSVLARIWDPETRTRLGFSKHTPPESVLASSSLSTREHPRGRSAAMVESLIGCQRGEKKG